MQTYCRWRRCLEIGMNVHAVRADNRLTLKATFPDQVTSLQKETMPVVPARFLGRLHTQNMPAFLAPRLPASSDLSPEAGNAALLFLMSLPGFEALSSDQRAYLTEQGVLHVMLVRFLSRYRPDVNAFLFPSGEFVYPAQLGADLPEGVVGALTACARQMACTGLTELELGLLSILVACEPLDPPPVYHRAWHTLTLSASTAMLVLVLSVQELLQSAPPSVWTALSLKP